MRTVADIMAAWPSDGTFASDIGVATKHARTMRDRGSIPSRYWKRTVEAAAARSITGVTLALLADLEDAKSFEAPPTSPADEEDAGAPNPERAA